MDRTQIEQALSASEAALEPGGKVDLGPYGFWKAVNAVKRQPLLVQEFGDRIGRIDQGAFQRSVFVKVPLGVGTALMLIGTLVGLALIGWAYRLTSMAQGLALLGGTVILLVTTHGLAHLVVGWFQGMRFTHWFIGRITRPQPGVKVDYATYLRIPARKRAWMHAAGAIVTKAIPFLSFGAGWAMKAPGWAMAVLAVVAVGQIVTDVVWSTKASDWKKFKREMRFSRDEG